CLSPSRNTPSFHSTPPENPNNHHKQTKHPLPPPLLLFPPPSPLPKKTAKTTPTMAPAENTSTTICGQPASSQEIAWCAQCFLTTLHMAAKLGIVPDTLRVLDVSSPTNPFASAFVDALRLRAAVEAGHGHLLPLLQAFVHAVVRYADAVRLFDVDCVGIRRWPASIAAGEEILTTDEVAAWLAARFLPPELPPVSRWGLLRLLLEPLQQEPPSSSSSQQPPLLLLPPPPSQPSSAQPRNQQQEQQQQRVTLPQGPSLASSSSSSPPNPSPRTPLRRGQSRDGPASRIHANSVKNMLRGLFTAHPASPLPPPPPQQSTALVPLPSPSSSLPVSSFPAPPSPSPWPRPTTATTTLLPPSLTSSSSPARPSFSSPFASASPSSPLASFSLSSPSVPARVPTRTSTYREGYASRPTISLDHHPRDIAERTQQKQTTTTTTTPAIVLTTAHDDPRPGAENKGKDGEKERERGEEEGFSLAAYTSATERYLANPTRENEAERDRLAELLRREILLRQGRTQGQGE
ncbi:hypothetical protein F5X98DRAFT_384317, partial [Xylaria grammica]